MSPIAAGTAVQAVQQMNKTIQEKKNVFHRNQELPRFITPISLLFFSFALSLSFNTEQNSLALESFFKKQTNKSKV